MLVVLLTACAVSPPPLPVPAPPPGFAQTNSLSTPTVDVPSEPSLGEADSEAAQNGNGTASPAGSASASTHAAACTGSAQGVPTWWLNIAGASWNLRLVLLACIVVVGICCCLGCFCKRCVFSRPSQYPIPPPYPYPYPHDPREQHAYQHREPPRPHSTRPPHRRRADPRDGRPSLGRSSSVGAIDWFRQWSEQRRPPTPSRAQPSARDDDECRL